MQWVMIGLGGVVVILAIVLAVMMRGGDTAANTTPNQLTDGPRPKPQPSASLNRQSNWLEGVAGSIQGKTYHVGSRDVTMGRKVGNYIQLIDDNVSRVHVKLKGNAQGVQITDQKTTLGTRVNGEKLVAGVPHMLADGDRLEIGEDAFIFRARADFPTNHGLTDQKVAGSAQMRQTAALGQLNWQQELADNLVKAGGDKARAAELMGLSPEVFEKMLEQAQSNGNS